MENGKDVIRDFKVDRDIIDVRAIAGVDDFATLRRHIQSMPWDRDTTYIGFNNKHDRENVLVLEDISLADLRTATFEF